jgi:hypothetical protein
LRNPRKYQNHRKALRFLISPEIAHSFFKIAPELYHNQSREIPENAKIKGKPLDFLISPETAPTFFKLALELYYNQFSI